MAIRATLLFSAGRQTWSESHYWMAGSTIANPAINAAVILANARAALLGQWANLDNVRLSDTLQPRNVLYLSPNTFNHSGAFPVDPTIDTYTSDRPNSSILIRFKGASRYKLMYLAGAPDGAIVENPAYPNGIKVLAGFAAPFNAWAAVLVGTWGFRIKANLNHNVILALVTNANYPGLIGVVTAGDLVVQVGGDVQVQGTKRNNPNGKTLNGVFTVRAIIPAGGSVENFTYFLNRTEGIDPTNFYKLGEASQLFFNTIPYTGTLIEKAVTRKRGGSIGLARGRSKTR